MFVTQCATRDGREKKTVFFLVLIAEFRLWSGLQNPFFFQYRNRAVTTQLITLGHLQKKYHQKEDKWTFITFHCSPV